MAQTAWQLNVVTIQTSGMFILSFFFYVGIILIQGWPNHETRQTHHDTVASRRRVHVQYSASRIISCATVPVDDYPTLFLTPALF